MDRILSAGKLIVPIIILLVLGALFRRKRIISIQGIADIKSIIINICLPAVIFSAFFNASYDKNTVIILIVVFSACLAAFAAGAGFKKLLKINYESMPFLVTGMEAGMLGYTLYGLLFGTQNTGNFAVIDFGQEIFIFTFYMTMLNIKSGDASYTFRKAAAGLLKTPPFIAIIAGLVFGVAGLGKMLNTTHAGSLIESTITFLSAPISALILLVIGFGIEFSRKNMKAALKAISVRLICLFALFLAAYFILSSFVPMSDMMKWALVLLFLLPPPFVLPIFMKKAEEQEYISTTLSLYTLISISAFMIIAFIAI